MIPEPLPPARRPVSSKKLYSSCKWENSGTPSWKKALLQTRASGCPPRLAKHQAWASGVRPPSTVLCCRTAANTRPFNTSRERRTDGPSACSTSSLPRVAGLGCPGTFWSAQTWGPQPGLSESLPAGFLPPGCLSRPTTRPGEVRPWSSREQGGPYREARALQGLFGEVKLSRPGPLGPGLCILSSGAGGSFNVYVTELITGDVSQLARLVTWSLNQSWISVSICPFLRFLTRSENFCRRT